MATETDPNSMPSDRLENPSESEPMDNLEQEVEEAGEGTDFEFDQRVEAESEGIDYTPLSANEDQEKQAAYREYKSLEKRMKHQNYILEDLKNNIQALQERKHCLNRAEKIELKNMHDCWERERCKLLELVEKAVNLQSTGSKRHYRELPLVTTFDEDNLNLAQRTCEILQDKSNIAHNKVNNFRATAGESSETNASCPHEESQISITEERKLMKDIFAAIKEINCLKACKQRTQSSSVPGKEHESFEKIKNKVKCMQQKIGKLTEELNTTDHNEGCHEKSLSTYFDPAACLCKVKGKSTNSIQQLKDNYLYLLTEFTKKDEQLKDLTKRLKNSCSKCAGGVGDSYSSDESELHLLRNRLNEMKEEQIEFKCLMKEQSVQLEEYRNKYLKAQQKVEEQTALIEKLNMNNKCIEKQINLEIKEIRAKFQERLADLLQFPKLLENEQIKLAKTCKEKEELENKLIVVCKELKTLKLKGQNNNIEDCKPQLIKCQQELNQLKKSMEEIQHQRDMFCEQLRSTTDDLNLLRSESAKIIARTKERAECIKQQQQEQIDRLEKQLAQCRATANLSVSDREAVIKEMQGQLNTLSYSFDTAQKQIKTLRNHIAFMSNENSFAAKCQ